MDHDSKEEIFMGRHSLSCILLGHGSFMDFCKMRSNPSYVLFVTTPLGKILAIVKVSMQDFFKAKFFE